MGSPYIIQADLEFTILLHHLSGLGLQVHSTIPDMGSYSSLCLCLPVSLCYILVCAHTLCAELCVLIWRLEVENGSLTDLEFPID